jgi:uncharacterized protein (DUF302 family)
MDPNFGNGLVHISSHYSVPETVDRLESLLHAQGITLFCRINHSAEAEKAGLEMRPTQVLVFGSPRAGTPLMIAAPSLAIDLPLKALIWEDTEDRVCVSYNSPGYLQQRHQFPDKLLGNIAGVGTLLQKAAS